MTDIDIEFLDLYKRTDRICADMYGVRNGISEYISSMERNMGHGSNIVPNWITTYNELKHLRWVRNQLVHEPSFSGCEEGDLDAIENFYDDVMHIRDPLATLKKQQCHHKSDSYPDVHWYVSSEPDPESVSCSSSERKLTPTAYNCSISPLRSNPAAKNFPVKKKTHFPWKVIVFILLAAVLVAYILGL